MPERSSVAAAAVVASLVVACLAVTQARQPAPLETGTFRLHKFEQAIGEETYTIARDGDGLRLESSFSFTDRGTPVPLTATLRTDPDYVPASFAIKGNTSRLSTIDQAVTLGSPGTATVRRDGASSAVAAPAGAFTIAGYAPVSLQMALVRYWKRHGSPAAIPTLPSGQVTIKPRGQERLTIDGRAVTLSRYSVRGVVWGLETIWTDEHDTLVALVTRDAEFDHFEAVRAGYESALTALVGSAARDEMAELDEISRVLPGRRTGTLAFTGVTVIDGTGRAPVAEATVVARDGRIVAVGPSASTPAPAGASVIDARGQFVVPGLWDMHAHYEQVEWGPIYLAAGVTTVRDMGNELEFITAVRDEVKAGRGLGPRLLLAGIVDGDGPMALGVERVNSPADAARWVKAYHDAGFEQMKIYSSVSAANVKAVVDEAHRVGMTVTGHVPNGMTLFEATEAGMDQVNHAQYLLPPLAPPGLDWQHASRDERAAALPGLSVSGPQGQRLVAALTSRHIVIDDTLALFETFLHPASEPLATIEPGAAKVAPELRAQYDGQGVPPERAAAARAQLAKYREIIGALHKAGVTFVAGTDQAVPGYSVYRELELYVQAGFTPLEALQAATIIPARVMKLEATSGTVEPGKRADFILLAADPLADIRNIRRVRQVVANGVLFDPAPLWKSVGFEP